MVKIHQLTKKYSNGKGIRDLNIYIPAGETFGFLGPNGAGKTTTIRVLMGFLRPDNGEVKINKLDSWRDRTKLKRYIGYLPGELHFFENLSGREFLELIIKMHGNIPEIRNNADHLMKRFDLEVKQPIRKMSKGMKQKLGIISALMLDAEVLILDEPTSGLDPLMQKVFIDLLLEEKEKGKTILISSHHFAEIERTCERVGMIDAGKLLTIQDIRQLKQMKYHIFEVVVESEEDAEYLRQSGIITGEDKGMRFTIKINGNLDLLWKILADVSVKEFHQHSIELEEAFMQYY